MNDAAATLALSTLALVALGMASIAALEGWRGWLELRQFELAHPVSRNTVSPSPAARIELADLKERVRKLEAIASGVDL
jgi:hypothetical protein